MELLFVTGLSGSGKSRVINALEDIGFFCADNLHPKLCHIGVWLAEAGLKIIPM